MSLDALELTDDDFQRVRTLLRRVAGIDLASGKHALVVSRLGNRVLRHGLTSFGAYLDVVERDDSEVGDFVSALTTNVTDFFREPHHFDAIRAHASAKHGGDDFSVWSSACSTGEEPWSVAMVLADLVPSRRWKVLATDIDEEVLRVAAAGEYGEDRVRPIPPGLAGKFLERDRSAARVRLDDSLRGQVHFAQLNLLGPWPMKTLFDVILCRNVLIYFDDRTRRLVGSRLVEQLQPGGLLLLGHSEGVLGSDLGLVPCGKTAYRRPERKVA